MIFFKCSSVQSTRKEDDLLIPTKGECKLEIIDSVGTLEVKIKKIKYPFSKTNLIAGDCEPDKTIIMHKVSISLISDFVSKFKFKIYERNYLLKDEEMSPSQSIFFLAQWILSLSKDMTTMISKWIAIDYLKKFKEI